MAARYSGFTVSGYPEACTAPYFYRKYVQMEIVFVAATPFEIAPLLEHLNKGFETREQGLFQRGELRVRALVTGIGISATSWHLGLLFGRQTPALAVNAGIAGAFGRDLQLGQVVHVTTERFGDLGVEEADGRFTDLFELGMADSSDAVSIRGKLYNPSAGQAAFLPPVHGLTVNKVHGTAVSISAIKKKYPEVQVESMEGAAFFHACLSAKVPFLQIRAISNYVETRNREAWDLPGAIRNLNRALLDLLESLGG